MITTQLTRLALEDMPRLEPPNMVTLQASLVSDQFDYVLIFNMRAGAGSSSPCLTKTLTLQLPDHTLTR